MNHRPPVEIAADFDRQIDDAYAALQSLLGSSSSLQPRQLQELTRKFGHGVAMIIAESVRLQSKARLKFGVLDVDKGRAHDERPWWAIDPSLQQSTPWQVARFKANWFEGKRVMDLCCGLGGDALQFAGTASELIAVDVHPVVAAIARANLAIAHPQGAWDVRNRDAGECNFDQSTALHIDPDRRAKGKRTTQINQFEPYWSQVVDWANRAQATLIKLAPATRADSNGFAKPVRRCWLSLSGSVREQTWLVGELENECDQSLASTSAIMIGADGQWKHFGAEPSDVEDVSASTNNVGAWVIDPDPAIRSAGLTKSFQEVFDLESLGSLKGFLTTHRETLGSTIHQLAMVRRVLWSGAADDRKLRRTLRENNWSVWTVKTRGTDHQPEQIVGRYRKLGEEPVMLWLGRTKKRVLATITEI